MNLAAVLRRIEHRLKVLGVTANAASKAAGKPDAIRNLRRAVAEGKRQGLTTSTLAALAVVLRTTSAWLSDGVGPEDPEADSEERTIPVWGKAGAGGSVRRHDSTDEIGRIAAFFETNDRTGAVEIEGDSLGKLFDGWYAIVDDLRTPPSTDLFGKVCVLEIADGRIFIKRLEKGRGKRFKLESNYEPPIYDVDVKWAAPVKSMVPR